MEFYDWDVSPSRKSLENLFNKSHSDIPNSASYSTAVNGLMNEGMPFEIAVP